MKENTNKKTNTNKNTNKKEEKKVVTIKEMLTVMKTLDNKADERKTTTSDIAVQCLSTVNAERIELWKRSNTHYDLYIGNVTNISKNLNNDFSSLKKLNNAISILTYVDDKKMSKREVLIKIIDRKNDTFEVVKKVINELKKYNKEIKNTTKEIKESENKAQ